MGILHTSQHREPWSNGWLIGQKAPLKLKDIWTIRIRLQLGHEVRDLALFNLTMDPQSARLRLGEAPSVRCISRRADGFASHGDGTEDRSPCSIRDHAIDSGGRTGLDHPHRTQGLRLPVHQPSVEFASPKVRPDRPSLGGRGGLTSGSYGTRTMRRTKASLIYRRTRSLRAVRLLLGHTKLESIVRYLGIEVDDALEIAEQTEG